MEFEKDFQSALISIPEQLIQILGVVYTHHKTRDGGDLYLTRYGLPYSGILETENWYETDWYEAHRVKLEGTSAVYKVTTREISGISLELVVKNSRFGEDVPMDTHTLMEFINAEFNSPWEEFAMVFEMRDGKFGPEDIRIKTQFPLAIYVPPEKMQLWQSGRSTDRVNRLLGRHPGISVDILRQYKLVYGWIKGKNIIESFQEIGLQDEDLIVHLPSITQKVIVDMDKKGYAVADMKPSHIIIDEVNIHQLHSLGENKTPNIREKQRIFLMDLIDKGDYSVVDYELLNRTPVHLETVNLERRHTYLDDQKNKFTASQLPPHLSGMTVFNVPYVFGHVESTGGLLWVVGRNPDLFDYFLPERWRTSHHWKLSKENDVFYTLTKDNIHIVWKASRVGETPQIQPENELSCKKAECGYNSPFEESAIAHFLNNNGVPAVFLRAIYMTGSKKQEASEDLGHYKSHNGLLCPDGTPILSEMHNYITIRGYYNGPDEWVSKQNGPLCRPVDLLKALHNGIIQKDEMLMLISLACDKLKNVGYNGSLLQPNDLIITYDPKGDIIQDKEGNPEARITNFEFIKKI